MTATVLDGNATRDEIFVDLGKRVGHLDAHGVTTQDELSAALERVDPAKAAERATAGGRWQGVR